MAFLVSILHFCFLNVNALISGYFFPYCSHLQSNSFIQTFPFQRFMIFVFTDALADKHILYEVYHSNYSANVEWRTKTSNNTQNTVISTFCKFSPSVCRSSLVFRENSMISVFLVKMFHFSYIFFFFTCNLYFCLFEMLEVLGCIFLSSSPKQITSRKLPSSCCCGWM